MSDTPTNQPPAAASSPHEFPLAASIAMLRCPATGETLTLQTDAQGPCVVNASRTIRYRIRDGVVLFVTGRQ